MRITHLQFDERTRQLTAMRAAMLKRSMSQYVTALVVADAEAAGLGDFVPYEPESVPDVMQREGQQ
jgi:hypothetical protein